MLEDAGVGAVLTRAGLTGRLPPGSAPRLEVDALDAGDPSGLDGAPGSDGAHPAYLLYTSGSTGRPKGVVVTHDNLSASHGARLDVYGGGPGRFLLVPSVAFDSSVAGLFWTLATGGTLVVPLDDEVGDPRRLAWLVEERRVQSLLAVPSLWGRDAGDRAGPAPGAGAGGGGRRALSPAAGGAARPVHAGHAPRQRVRSHRGDRVGDGLPARPGGRPGAGAHRAPDPGGPGRGRGRAWAAGAGRHPRPGLDHRPDRGPGGTGGDRSARRSASWREAWAPARTARPRTGRAIA